VQTAPEVTCTRCKRRLNIPDGVEEVQLTCPSCLAEVVHPARQAGAIQATAPSGVAPSPVTAEQPQAAQMSASRDRCANCGRPSSEGWTVCPYCGRTLASWRLPRQPRGDSVDADVSRDNVGVGRGTIALAVLGAVALVFFPWIWFRSLGSFQQPFFFSFLPVSGIVFLLGIVAIVVGIRSRQGNRIANAALVRILAGVGILAAVLIAILLLFLLSCMVSPPRML
jgi:hypothetical protein